MNPSKPILCFESLEDLKLYSYFSKLDFPLYTVHELLEKYGNKPLSPIETEILVKSLLTEEEVPELNRFSETIEQLRLSLILNEEQVNHCFLELPKTPSYLRLKDLCHAYLKTPLSNADLCAKMWSLIGKLKTKELSSTGERIYFLKSMRSTFLFQELAASFSSTFGSENIFFIEAWQLSLIPSERVLSKRLYSDSATSSLIKNLVDTLSLNSVNSKIRIGLKCKPHALSFLEFYLKHKRIKYRFSSDETPKINSESDSVVLYPLSLLAPDPDWTDVILIDDSFFEPTSSLCLSEHSLNALELQGFTIPRLSTDREYWKRGFGALGATIYTSLSTQDTLNLFTIPSQPIENTQALEPRFTAPEIPTFGSKTTLSATALENFAVCPAKYFIENQLRLRPLNTPDDDFNLILGLATHNALENYLRLEHQSLTPSLPELFELSLTKIAPKLLNTDPNYLMLKMAFRKFAKNFERMEVELKQKINFKKNSSLEHVFTVSFSEFQFSGKIDRVIETTEGYKLLLDYKTGTVDFSPNHILNGVHFQALLYILACESESPNIGLLFYALKQGELRRGLLKEELISKEFKSSVTRGHALLVDKWENIIETGKKHLLSVAALIQQGRFDATPSSSNCSACQAKPLCRIGVPYV